MSDSCASTLTGSLKLKDCEFGEARLLKRLIMNGSHIPI